MLAVGAVASLCTATADAVRVTQHLIPKLKPGETVFPATAIFSGPGGLVVAGSRSGAYETVTTTPTFGVSPGVVGTNEASYFFLGPDGQTWYLSGEAKPEPDGTKANYTTLDEITGGGPAPRFAFRYSDPILGATTGPDGAIWLTDPTGRILRYSNPTLTAYIPTNGAAAPFAIVSGPGGDLWTTDIVTSTIAQVTPQGNVVEHILPGPRFGEFGNDDPYGAVVGPDDAVWFAEQDADAIGRITAAGEIQTFPIPIPPGTSPLGADYPAPRDLAIGPEGAVWFTDPGTDSVGRVQGGAVTEYPIPKAQPAGPIVSAGGELWITEETPELGSVNPTLPPLAEPTTSKPQSKVASQQVMSMLSVPSWALRSTRLLKQDGYTPRISIPASDTASVYWTSGKVVVAHGHTAFSPTRSTNLAIRLTARGRGLLERSRRLRLLATGSLLLQTKVTLRGQRALTVQP